MAKDDILEDLELSSRTGAARPIGRLEGLFPALSHRNFQLYTIGQVISLVGFWLQQVGVGYLIFHMTHSEFWVGVAAAVSGLPFLLFTMFAGVFIERMDKKRLLFMTQISEATTCIILGVLALTNHATLPVVLFLVFVIGVIEAVDLPTRFTFLIEMVGKEDLSSAVPINNSLFNTARFVGPAAAGILIAATSVGWTFILNGISFLAGIWAIYQVKPIYSPHLDTDTHPFESLKIGIKYSFTHPKIMYFILLGFCSAIFIWPFQALMPAIADKVFSSGAHGLGSLLSAAGAGSLTGAIFTSVNSKKKNKIPYILFGILISSLGLLAFSINRNFLLAHVFLYVSGFGILTMISTMNALVQVYSPDSMRARINAVYLAMLVGMMPLGSLLAGFFAQHTSSMFVLGTYSIIMIAIAAALYFKGVFANLATNP